jgi:hypothetical protein
MATPIGAGHDAALATIADVLGLEHDVATLKQFFTLLGPERCAELEAVTIDMSTAYIKARFCGGPEILICL